MNKLIKNVLRCFLASGVLFFAFSHSLNAQTIVRQSIGSYGSSGKSGVSQTIGQPYSTQSVNKSATLQGFQQSTVLKITKTPTPITEDNLNIKVYPNPAKHGVAIEFTDEMDGGTIQVHTIEGKKVYEATIGEQSTFSKFQFSCNDWLDGSYLIKVRTSSNKQSIHKLIISK